MEFFASADIHAQAADLHERLSIARLAHWCASINQVLSDQGTTGEIYCIWGQFRVNLEPIRDGVRFSLPDCPNALQWTLTTGRPPWPDQVVVHLTINRTEHDPEVVESMQQFVLDWKIGLEAQWMRP